MPGLMRRTEGRHNNALYVCICERIYSYVPQYKTIIRINVYDFCYLACTFILVTSTLLIKSLQALVMLEKAPETNSKSDKAGKVVRKYFLFSSV